MLKRYNFRTGPQLARGERIIVPITHVKVRDAKLPRPGNVAAEEIAARKATSARVAAAFEDALRLYRDGQYTEVASRLIKILSEEDPTEDEIADIQELMAFCYVALDQHELAARAFREVVARRPAMTLDPAEVSPKIRAAFDEARRPERPSP
jgi:hypothetical protein